LLLIPIVVWIGVWLISVESGPAATGEPVPKPQLHKELPDDPPGKPARPVPGAIPARVIRMGIAATYQVNIDSLGANIPGDAANEPSIAVDPNNPNTMAIGWRQFDTISSNFRQAGWGYTTDGGRNWTFPGVIEPGIFRSDPVLESNAEGEFFYNSLKVIGGVFTTQVFKSADGGATWLSFAEAYGGDKQWMTIDRTGGTGHGFIYQTWSAGLGCCADSSFNRSVDGGTTFSYPVYMPGTPIWGELDVDADGNVYVAGIDPDDTSIFFVIKSTNAKDAMATPSFTPLFPMIMNGSIKFGLGPNPGGLLGPVQLAVDRSGGPYHGYIYVLASVDPPGIDPLDVHFVRSTDGGASWEWPVRLNTDPAESWAWNWFATMSVAPNGRIDVIWNDNRNNFAANMAELFYTSSSDGGSTWTAEQQLSPVFNSHLGWPQQDKLGDYYDMVSDDVGASLAWAATFNGEQDVYYTRIGGYDCNANGVPDSVDIATKQSADFNGNGIPDECEGLQSGAGDAVVATSWSLDQNVPNPFNPYTKIRFVVPDGGAFVTLRVYDVRGALVRTLVDGYREAGAGGVTWDGRDRRGNGVASGLYFYRLEADGFTQTRKMLLLR
jgi:hypothetical protein